MNKKFTTPATMDQGSFSGMADSRKDALWQYNSARAHDGLAPIKRLPNGTYWHTTYYIKRINETVDEFYSYKEAVKMLAEYRLSDSSAPYSISTRG